MAEGVNMKNGIHPTYNKVKAVCVSCGAEFETGSTLKEIRVDTCSKCHPFYTGEQKFVQTTGRIDRFNKRISMAKKENK
jgi:large subunit ribosomal protein L31